MPSKERQKMIHAADQEFLADVDITGDVGITGTLTAAGFTSSVATIANGTDTDLPMKTGIVAVIQAILKHVSGTVVNALTFKGAVTTASVELGAEGTDAAIDIKLAPKGVGVVRLAEVASVADTDLLLGTGVTKVTQAKVKHVTGTIVNQLGLLGAVAGAKPEIAAEGSDTNLDVLLTPKGTGLVRTASGFIATADAVVPTSDGLSTGLIAAGVTLAELTPTDVNHIATLPAGVAALVGVEITIYMLGALDCELRTPDSGNATINGVDADGSDEFRLISGSIYKAELTAVDTWVLRGTNVNGFPEAQRPTVTVVPTSDGLIAGLIGAGVRKVITTSTNADWIITLPAGVADLVGETIEIVPIGGTNCELRTPDAGNATVNGVDCDGTQEALMTSGSVYRLTLVAVDTWVMSCVTSAGAALTVTPD